MATYNTAEIVHTEAMLGGIRYRVYTHDKHTGRVLSVGVLTLTPRDLAHAQTLIAEARIKHAAEDQTSLPF